MTILSRKRPSSGLSEVGTRVKDPASQITLEHNDQAGSVHQEPHTYPAAYSIGQFAAAFGLSRSHVYNLFQRGEGPARFYAGRRMLLSREAVSAWVSRMEALAEAKSVGDQR